jgi:hypothetical protein
MIPTWAVLSMWLLMSIGGMILSSLQHERDGNIAKRQQTVPGQIDKITTGNRHSAHYSFKFEGRVYHAASRDDPSMRVGDSVTVYLDPMDPEESSLDDYWSVSEQNHTMIVFFGVMSVVAAVSLALVWSKRIPG